MQLFKISIKQIIYLFVYALINSILSFGLIYIINNVLIGKKEFIKDYMGIVFTATFIYSYLLNIIFQKHLNTYAFTTLYNNEKILFTKFLQTPLRVFEKLGSQRFFTAVEDLRIFSFLPYTVTHTVNSILMIILGLSYMFLLSFNGGLIILSLIFLVAMCYFLVINSMSKEVESLRGFNDSYYKYVDDVIKGFKELQINPFRKQNLLNKFLYPNRTSAGKLDNKINYTFLSINLISQYGLYLIIAFILFVIPALNIIQQKDIISYIIILLFISGPINNLVNLQHMYTRFIVANKRINSFIHDFRIDEDAKKLNRIKSNFESIQFRDVEFRYSNKDEESQFSLGPINLKVEKGETIFIIGGNGSGKSTLINLLTGLYPPSKGEIIINKKQGKKFNDYIQNYISAVFTDNHIFSNNFEEYDLVDNAKYKSLLKLMKLDHKINDNSVPENLQNLSKGQSKRLSLIFALLEKKPILILDEWAADQDPQYRKFFYEELLPKFKKEGKTIIAVTHDDSYFHYADRILKFEFGKIVIDMPTKEKKIISDIF